MCAKSDDLKKRLTYGCCNIVLQYDKSTQLIRHEDFPIAALACYYRVLTSEQGRSTTCRWQARGVRKCRDPNAEGAPISHERIWGWGHAGYDVVVLQTAGELWKHTGNYAECTNQEFVSCDLPLLDQLS